MRAIVLVNAAAGAVAADGPPVPPANGGRARPSEPSALTRVEEAVRQAGLDARVVAVEPGDLRPTIEQAAASPDVDAVVVAGGDGTVSSAASVLAGGEKPLGVIPLGTLNHFARDLGLPSDTQAAAAALSAGHWREVDVGDVNGRTFVNNCAIGLYPEAVRRRETRRRSGEKKWPAMMRGLREVLQRLPLLRLTLRTDDRMLRVATPLLMVGNNRYETDLLRLGQRTTLDEGVLWVYLARSTGAGGVLKLGLRALAGRLDQSRDFESLCTASLEVSDQRRRRHLTVAVDGEVDQLQPPLLLRSRPRSLRVLVPPGGE